MTPRGGERIRGRSRTPATPPTETHGMAKRDLTSGQRKIVNRYYEHLDTIVATRLQELVTDLYLAETDAKQARLWTRVKQQLAKTPADPDRCAVIIESGDTEALATLVGKLVAGDRGVLREKGS